MATRTQRATPYLWCGVIALVGAGVGIVAGPHVHHGLDTFTVAVLVAAGLAVAAACVVAVDPAWILTGGLLLSVFSGNWGNVGVPLPLDRFAIFGGLVAVAVDAWRRRDEVRIHVRTVHWLMLALILYAVVSAAWSNTLTSHAPLFALLDRLGLVPFLLFLVAPVAFRTRHQRRILAVGLLILGAYLGLVTLFEAVHLNSLVVPKYILNPNLGLHAGRGRGPFLEAGANGLAMFECAIAAFLVASWWRDRRVRIAAGIVMALCAAGILFTLTRQTWIAAGAGAAAAMVSDRRLRPWLPAAAIAAAVVVLASLTAIPGLQQNVSRRASDQTPVWDRLNSDAAALRMVEDQPAIGFGWGRFGADSRPYYRLAATYPLTSVGTAHNMTLSNASELGLSGAALWLTIIVLAIVIPACRRASPEIEPWRIGLIAVAVAWFIQSNFTPLDYAFDNYVVWLWAGIVAIGSNRRAPRVSAPPETAASKPRMMRRPTAIGAPQ
jgi:putative inorganic carbon (hco3(-)) transporter